MEEWEETLANTKMEIDETRERAEEKKGRGEKRNGGKQENG